MSSTSGFARHFLACNTHDLSRFVPLFIDGKRYGYVKTELATSLPKATSQFIEKDGGIELAPHLSTFTARTDGLTQATSWISELYGKPLRDELYAVTDVWDSQAIAQIDRAAVPWFGVRAWGVHVNGYVRKADGIHLWIGERAADRPADPGKLDNLVGGGQPFGLTVEQNLCKEAKEEAGIDAKLALSAKFAGKINYRLERKDGLRSDTLFIYDLELPESFVPQNTDGEVASFDLMPLAEVARLVSDTDAFKFNCNLVIIDFLMRQGFFPRSHAEYADINSWLKR